MTELTVEITDFCPHSCSYCSSEAGPSKRTFLSIGKIKTILGKKTWDVINISGGEPLAHPDFWKILQFCKTKVTARTGVVTVYTNALESIRYNASVIPGVRVEANLAVIPGTSKVHVLKMVNQGCEARKPEVHFSRNWLKLGCKGCQHAVIRPDGKMVASPCRKHCVRSKGSANFPRKLNLRPKQVKWDRWGW